MEHGHNLVEIPGLLQNKVCKRLLFSAHGLTIEKPLSYDKDVFIAAEDIAAFRYEVKWIHGYKFTFGRQYIVYIQDYNNKTFTIKLGSFYGLRRDVYHDLWLNILEQLWQYYFVNTLNYYVELHHIRQVFEIAGVKFHPHGISWGNSTSLFWNEIALSSYNNYFMIYRTENPKQHKSCSFANDWNAIILQSLLKRIVEEQISFRNSSV